MKKFFILATLLVLAPVVAQAASKQTRAKAPAPVEESLPCGAVNTPMELLVTDETPGYRKVDVTLDIDVPMGTSGKMPSSVAFAFGLNTKEHVRRDALGAIKWLSRCDRDVIHNGRIYKAGSLWMKVRTAITKSDIWPDEKGITVHAVVWLPESVIDEEPPAYTLLKNNVWYTGAWEKAESGAVTLALKP